ncbi:hypothetical protein Nans01_29310 [Nocardiopsis ansamitocini]|uniref:Methyltransferase domain-containing protein n=2 Tax=Nocardiopsis ansamitocini TaxID=1670832 RepID=A0A9W6P6W8_9ACTN|nr:hypothetical protein Nans01_29310 [Nocardiopsis ansamitocini]
MLAARCDSLVAWEGAETAVVRAQEHLRGAEHVHLAQGRIPQDWPSGDFDLVVLSELLYYFDGTDLDAVLSRTVSALRPGATLLAVHWRHEVVEHVRTGDDVHAALGSLPGLVRVVGHVETDFVLDVFEAPGPGGARSVAQREGLA